MSSERNFSVEAIRQLSCFSLPCAIGTAIVVQIGIEAKKVPIPTRNERPVAVIHHAGCSYPDSSDPQSDPAWRQGRGWSAGSLKHCPSEERLGVEPFIVRMLCSRWSNCRGHGRVARFSIVAALLHVRQIFANTV